MKKSLIAYLLVITTASLFLVIGLMGCTACSKGEPEPAQPPVVETETAEPEPVEPTEEETDVVEAKPENLFPEPFYMVLFGTDGRPGETSFRSDAIVLCRVDTINKKVSMLSIPRDLRVSIPGHSTTKINAAYAYGGPELAVETIEQFTGVTVDRYISMGFEDFVYAVNIMGGLIIEVTDRVDDGINVGWFVIEVGEHNLDGEKLLGYARTRKYPDGDYSRTRHHREILKATIDQYFTEDLYSDRMVEALGGYSTTNLTAEEIVSLSAHLEGITSADVTSGFVPSHSQTISGVSYIVHDEAAWNEMLGKFTSGATDWSNETR